MINRDPIRFRALGARNLSHLTANVSETSLAWKAAAMSDAI